jgi:hypothetical protein
MQPNSPFTLQRWPLPARVLATAIIVMLGLGLAVAVVQATVHDVLPTMRKLNQAYDHNIMHDAPAAQGRGDLLADLPTAEAPAPAAWHQSDNFIFALKFTHIHIFGMSGIFIVMGALAVFLNRPAGLRCWLIALPFAGILIDLLGIWLKLFVHPAFFWLHIPGGLMFGVIFAVDALLMLRELWLRQPESLRLD